MKANRPTKTLARIIKDILPKGCFPVYDIRDQFVSEVFWFEDSNKLSIQKTKVYPDSDRWTADSLLISSPTIEGLRKQRDRRIEALTSLPYYNDQIIYQTVEVDMTYDDLLNIWWCKEVYWFPWTE